MALESQLENLLDLLYSAIRYRIIIMICHTLIYGIYLCLAPIAVYVMITNGLRNRSRKWLFAMTTFMFALSTVYWIVSVVFTFISVDFLNNVINVCYDSGPKASFCIDSQLANTHAIPAGAWLEMFDDILLINYTIADSVIVWRAWVLCSDQRMVVLMTPVVMLVFNTVIYLGIIVLRVIELIASTGDKGRDTVVNILNITQSVHLGFSLLINIFATSIIALKAWKYRKLLTECGIGIRTPRQSIRILALVVESGLIYILIGVTSLISITFTMNFGHGEISSIIVPMAIQLVGIYPIGVVLLVEQTRSLSSTYGSFGTIVDVLGPDLHKLRNT